MLYSITLWNSWNSFQLFNACPYTELNRNFRHDHVTDDAQPPGLQNWNSYLPCNSCYWSWACCQRLFCSERHTNEAKESIQSRIDPFASFVCQTADNCNKSYFSAVKDAGKIFITVLVLIISNKTLVILKINKKNSWSSFMFASNLHTFVSDFSAINQRIGQCSCSIKTDKC